MTRLTPHTFSDNRNTSLSVETAATYIGVSTATIRNWVKAGHLKPTSSRPILFQQNELSRLKDAIKSGDVARLRIRANKTKSSTTSIPTEYANNTSDIELVDYIVTSVQRERIDTCIVIFIITIRILELHGEVRHFASRDLSDITSFHSWKRQSVKDEMYEWHSTLHASKFTNEYVDIYNHIKYATSDDIIGFIYQALNHEGDKSTRGSYYTPLKVVTDSLSSKRGAVSSFLDPCCGAGQYLVRAAKVLGLPLRNIYGFDNDEVATRIARINLLLAFPSTDIRPNIECINAITELATGELLCPTNNLLGSFDFVATNPPWGAYKNKQLPSHLANGIRSNEAFSLFIAKSIHLLRDGGTLSFILPESILKIRVHGDVREIILKQTRIVRILKLGRQFSGVFTAAIRLDLVKGIPPKGALVSIEEGSRVHEIEQSRFLSNEYFAFEINVTRTEDRILKKLYANDFVTLRGNAEWALGIVTGNNKEFVSDRPAHKMEPIYKGSDVLGYNLNNPSRYIMFTPEKFQQVAKTELYRAREKLVYKFISKKLVFAYDDKQRLTLNSANIIIPRLPGISVKVALAFLNSNVFQYIFCKKFSTHKVLRGDLETLPFPRITPEVSGQIERVVDELIAGRTMGATLNTLIYSVFGLSVEDIMQIESEVLK